MALSERNPEAARKLTEELCIPTWYTDYKEMLEKEKPDVVHICTPNNTHFQIARDVIESGAFAYCEKPLGMDSKETTELAQMVIARGTKAGVNFNYRQNAMVREMHERLQVLLSAQPLQPFIVGLQAGDDVVVQADSRS